METYYNVFVRNWWRRNPAYPGGKEPGAGKKTYLRKHVIYADARAICKHYNDNHDPGFLSRKAECRPALNDERVWRVVAETRRQSMKKEISQSAARGLLKACKLVLKSVQKWTDDMSLGSSRVDWKPEAKILRDAIKTAEGK